MSFYVLWYILVPYQQNPIHAFLIDIGLISKTCQILLDDSSSFFCARLFQNWPNFGNPELVEQQSFCGYIAAAAALPQSNGTWSWSLIHLLAQLFCNVATVVEESCRFQDLSQCTADSPGLARHPKLTPICFYPLYVIELHDLGNLRQEQTCCQP